MHMMKSAWTYMINLFKMITLVQLNTYCTYGITCMHAARMYVTISFVIRGQHMMQLLVNMQQKCTENIRRPTILTEEVTVRGPLS